ncbi:MAG: hypothetical protein IKR12_03115 [Clostridia bacterium]|nr:hypothetical protein [Clostridia bacterium]
MKHCDKCDVSIIDDISNCPLCGRDISDNQQVSQTFLCYPNNKTRNDKRNMAMNWLFWIVVVGTIISGIVELLIFKHYRYNFYVLTGAFLAIINIILPIKYRWSFSAISIVASLTLCAYILFLELFTHSFGWGVYYVIPLFLLFMTLYSLTIILIRNYYKRFEFVISLIIFSVLSLVLFLYNYLSKGIIWPSLVAFLTSVTCFIFLLIFRFKKVKQALEKSFFI